MKTTLLTLGILLAAQNSFAASCEAYFKKTKIPAQKIQRTLNCNLLTQSNDSSNAIYLNHDQLCVTEYTAEAGNTVSSLNFVTRGMNNLTVQVPHKAVSLQNDILKVTELNYVTNGGLLPLFFKKTEIVISNNSGSKQALALNITEGKRVGGNVETVFSGTYACRKANSILDLFDL